jgi:hypothetical protein
MKKLFWLLFPVLFVVFFYAGKSGASLALDTAAANMPAVKYFNQSALAVKEPIEKYGALAGIGLWLAGLLLSVIIYLIIRVIGLKKIATVAAIIISFGLLAALGYELVWLEDRRTILSAAIPLYIGMPLFIAGLVTAICGVLIYRPRIDSANSKVKSDSAKVAVLLVAIAGLTSGCSLIGDTQYLACGFMNDPHCYQEAAVSTDDPAKCEQVTPPADFAKMGSNPPRDKCLLMIAQNKGDASKCNGIKGGIGSYTKEECVQGVAGTKLDDVKSTLEKTNNGKNATDEQKKKMQQEMEATQKMFEMLTNMQKTNFETQKAIIGNLR